jgi:hypothetical protein
MKTTFAIISALFAASTTLAAPLAAGAPAVQTATVSFNNDQSGRNAPIVAPLDGTVISISAALANSPLYVNGAVTATSAQFVAFPQGAACVINNNGAIVTLNSQKTFVDLDGNPNAAVPVNLNGATLQCEL